MRLYFSLLFFASQMVVSSVPLRNSRVSRRVVKRWGGAGDGRDQDEAFIMVRGKCCNKKWKGFRVHLSTANSLGAVQASMHCSGRRGEGWR